MQGLTYVHGCVQVKKLFVEETVHILRALGFNSTAAKRRAQLMAELEHKIAGVSHSTALLSCLSACRSVCLRVCLSVCLAICLFALLFVCLSDRHRWSDGLSVFSLVFLPVCLSVCLSDRRGLSVCLCFRLFVLSLCLSDRRSVYLSFRLFVCMSV